MTSFHFTVRINSKSFLWAVRRVQEVYVLPTISATSEYWVNHIRDCSCLASDVEKSRLDWKLKVSNTADNAGIIQSQERNTRHRRIQELKQLVRQ